MGSSCSLRFWAASAMGTEKNWDTSWMVRESSDHDTACGAMPSLAMWRFINTSDGMIFTNQYWYLPMHQFNPTAKELFPFSPLPIEESNLTPFFHSPVPPTTQNLDYHRTALSTPRIKNKHQKKTLILPSLPFLPIQNLRASAIATKLKHSSLPWETKPPPA